MQPVSLALLWHQHQPYYPDDVTGETLMPWVRLHGTKDYYGMAMHLREVPEFRCTINLVPSLLVQLQRYTERRGSDRHLDVSRTPADGLSEADVLYLLDHFFMANPDQMIRPYPRYQELYVKRSPASETSESVCRRFNERDLRDLQVWNNLTWFHEIAFEQSQELREFRAQGRHWTEGQKQWLLDQQLEILRQIIPLHRELSDSGQVELTTTPFYHPILPLLWDKRLARQAMPHCELPNMLESYAADARLHIDRAVAFHTELFGTPPRGMWPSEGSVAQSIIPAIAESGVQWIATDEEILAHSTGGWIARDPQGLMRHPEMLYRPWRVEEQGQNLQIVFRDHGLSDLIGFHYQRSPAQRAAQDLIGRVEGIGRAVEHNMGGRPALVSIILDGENCWEYYPGGGREFLRTLYQGCVQNPAIRTERLSDYLTEYPATDRINQLFAGSWISHNFAIWIGHHEDNTAWDLLHQTRQFLLQMKVAPPSGITAHDLARAAEELYIAEGSDWFWWFGDDHSSSQDALFDQLFRRHLQNVYTLLGVPVPSNLNRPISANEKKVLHTQPTGFLDVKVDGRRSSYFEWLNAGHYVAGSERGTMTLVSEGVIRELYFGFSPDNFMLRLDLSEPARQVLQRADELRIAFVEPSGYVLRIFQPSRPKATIELYNDTGLVAEAQVQFAADQIIELTFRFEDLGLTPNSPLHLFVELFAEKQSLDRVPREGTLELLAPSRDYERILWQA